MFLIAPERFQCQRALLKLHRTLEHLSPGPVVLLPLDDYWLGWFSAKPSDNLHVFLDGIVVGKLDFAESRSLSPQYHEDQMPSELHPLLTATRVSSAGENVLVEPHGIINVFYKAQTVSDMQLLIADATGDLPGPTQVAVLARVGYLPGNITLFDTIRKIPFLHGYDLTSRTEVRVGDYPYVRNDDKLMVERLVEIVPRGVEIQHAITGGYDSRFVLGCLLTSGVKPELVHLTSQEEDVVRRLSEEVGLSLSISDGETQHDLYHYTLLTDGQIYAWGGNYSRLGSQLTEDTVYSTGLFADSILKNAMKTAWKKPGSAGTIFERLVDYALLGQPLGPTSALSVNDQAVRSYLLDALSFEKEYYDFPTKKEWANWFYYINRGIRWSPATMADLSFYTYPIFLLSDLQALTLGLSSSAWSNYRHERVRHLNHRLLPTVTTPYVDGKPVGGESQLLMPLLKVKYEYADRFLQRLWDRRAAPERSRKVNDRGIGPSLELPEFSAYFDRPLGELLRADCTHGEKRAALTVHCVLRYLLES